MEKRSGSKEPSTIETNKFKKTGFENMRLTSESVTNAGTEIKKGFDVLGSKNVSPESKKAIREKIESVKRTLAKIAALVALSLPVGMLGNMAYVEGTRHEETATKTTPEESSESEVPFAVRSIGRSQDTLDPEAQLAQKMLFDLATLLREHELGIERISPSELAQLAADTAVENAMETYNESMSAEQLAQQIRHEIEGTCSEPSCDINEALTDAGWALDRHIDHDHKFANPDETHKFLEAECEINPNKFPAGLAYAQLANRPDLMEETLRRIQDRASDEDRTGLTSIYEAIQRTSLYGDPVAMESLSPGMRETIRSAYAAQEQRLREERASLSADLERANREAANAEANPFAEPSEPDVMQTPNTLNHQLAVIDQQISTINRKVTELSK